MDGLASLKTTFVIANYECPSLFHANAQLLLG